MDGSPIGLGILFLNQTDGSITSILVGSMYPEILLMDYGSGQKASAGIGHAKKSGPSCGHKILQTGFT